MSGFEFTFMGQAAAFDAVTLCGLLCAAVSFSGFCFALSQEHKMKRTLNRARNHPRAC